MAADRTVRPSLDAMQVKPQMLEPVLAALAPHVTPNHLILSIAAGVQLASIESALPEGTRVVRPTTGCWAGLLQASSLEQAG